jgi:hypothetical protein
LIASYLRVSELLQASALSRTLHSLFDSAAVWRGRLKEAEAVQYAPFEEPEPTCAVLSPAQLAALLPLPSLSAVVALCLQALLRALKQRCEEEDLPSWQRGGYETTAARLTAIVHVPSTLAYPAKHHHTATCHDPHNGPYNSVDYRAAYIEFELKHSQDGGDGGQ